MVERDRERKRKERDTRVATKHTRHTRSHEAREGSTGCLLVITVIVFGLRLHRIMNTVCSSGKNYTKILKVTRLCKDPRNLKKNKTDSIWHDCTSHHVEELDKESRREHQDLQGYVE